MLGKTAEAVALYAISNFASTIYYRHQEYRADMEGMKYLTKKELAHLRLYFIKEHRLRELGNKLSTQASFWARFMNKFNNTRDVFMHGSLPTRNAYFKEAFYEKEGDLPLKLVIEECKNSDPVEISISNEVNKKIRSLIRFSKEEEDLFATMEVIVRKHLTNDNIEIKYFNQNSYTYTLDLLNFKTDEIYDLFEKIINIPKPIMFRLEYEKEKFTSEIVDQHANKLLQAYPEYTYKKGDYLIKDEGEKIICTLKFSRKDIA